LLTTLLLQCENPTPNTISVDVSSARTALIHPADVPLPTTADAGNQAAGEQRVSDNVAPSLSIESVAALSERAILAVTHAKLFHVSDGRWQELVLDGAVAQSVIAANNALWVLAMGTGANDNRALILRSSDADVLITALVVQAPVPGQSWVARSFATNRQANTWWIGGSSPALTRVDATGGVRVESAAAMPELDSLYAAGDESIVALRRDGDFEVFRYGEHSTVVGDGHLQSLSDDTGVSFVIHSDGAVWRGRPGRELRRIAQRAPFEPRAGTVLANAKPILVGAGGPLATWRGGHWQVIPGEWPAEPVAITTTDPPMVIGRDGSVVLANESARVILQPSPASSATAPN
jgi:hypothetical protein